MPDDIIENFLHHPEDNRINLICKVRLKSLISKKAFQIGDTLDHLKLHLNRFRQPGFGYLISIEAFAYIAQICNCLTEQLFCELDFFDVFRSWLKSVKVELCETE